MTLPFGTWPPPNPISQSTDALETTGAAVNVGNAAPPEPLQVLTVVDPTHATWQMSSPPLLLARTVYVNSVSGNDSNDGSVTAPFATFQRGFLERQKYGELRAVFTLQLQGAGPYSLPGTIQSSVCGGDDGWFVLRGDPTAETIHTTGTFTGDFAGMVVPTSAGLGADTQRGRFCRVTSGVCNGAIFVIGENTDTSLTPLSKAFRVSLGAIVNGTTFEIFTPGTTIAVASPNVTIGGLSGGPQTAPRHIFFDLRFAGAAPSFGFYFSSVTMFACRFEGGFFAGNTNLSTISSSMTPPASVGLSSAQLLSAGISCNGFVSFVAWVQGTILAYFGSSFSIGNSGATLFLTGVRIVGPTSVFQMTYLQIGGVFTQAGAVIINSTIDVFDGGKCDIRGSVGLGKFAVTSGACLKVRRGGLVSWLATGAAYSGGTTDPAAAAVDVTGGGRVYFVNLTPTVTGGTAGRDLRTTANPVGVANATLNANGTTVDVLGSPFGDSLVRVAA